MTRVSRTHRWGTLLSLELKHLLRGGGVPAAVVLTLAAGAFGIHHGGTLVERQRAAIEAAPLLQQEQHRAVLSDAAPGAPAGDQLYYLFFHTVHEPSPWAAFSIGQRDVQPQGAAVGLAGPAS